jgi:hypothetical protein
VKLSDTAEADLGSSLLGLLGVEQEEAKTISKDKKHKSNDLIFMMISFLYSN